MPEFKLIGNFQANSVLAEEISRDALKRWGDEELFLSGLCKKADIASLARDNNNILLGFSIAKRICLENCIAVAFLATRVLADFRNRGIAKELLGLIYKDFILKEKILKIKNWLKPAYFITVTANPVVFDNIFRRCHITPSLKPSDPGSIETALAGEFAGIFSSRENFNPRDFVLKNAFLHSAEYYAASSVIPWSRDEKVNTFLESRLRLKENPGNGIVVVGRLL